MSYKIPFSGRAHNYTEEERAVVLKAMDDAVPLTQGKYLAQFQEKFAEYIGVPYAFGVNNATSALELSAQLCQFDEERDEVVCPSHTFTASLYPFIKKGGTAVWADIDPDRRVVTLETIKKVVTDRTKAVIVVHLYGYAIPDIREIADFCKERDIFLIEDTAQALGTEVNGEKAGSFGDFGVFSFHSHKNITTLGEGGMLTLKDDKFAKLIPMLRHNGHDGWKFERDNYWTPAMGNVDLPELNGEGLFPNNFSLGEVESALGTKLLERIEKINSEKRERAIKFIDEVSQISSLLKFHREESVQHNYHLLAVEVLHGKRDLFMQKMSEERSIQCVVQYYPLHRYDFYTKLGFGEAEVPNTDQFFDNMVSIPFHHSLTDEEFQYILKSTKEVLLEIER
jgi:perosamine synthetase